MRTACIAALGMSGCASTGPRDAYPHERAFPRGFTPPISTATGRPIYGWGGDPAGHGEPSPGSPSHTPVLFIHGNTVDATYWNKARTYFRAAGYRDDELWAPSHGHGGTTTFDSNDLSAPTLNAFVDEVQRYLSKRAGRPIRQFDIVAHSLGVTAVRQWLTQTNRWHEVRNFVAVAGANHGVWTALPDARGPSRIASFELAVGSPWLAQLNAGGETAGATRMMTLYDGTGRYDVLFPEPLQDSPALAGATNIAFNRAADTWAGGYGHLELPREPATMAVIVDFLRAADEAVPPAAPPQLAQRGDTVQATTPDTALHCAAGGRYPDRATPMLRAAAIPADQWLTCYAHNPRTGLSSPMARFARRPAAVSSAPLTLAASPPPGPYADPATITLTASEPGALIVYSTAGTMPDSGAALYRAPVYVAAPVTMTAIAIAPDGRQSAPLRLRYDISLEYQDALHTLQRQLDPATPVEFEGRNRSGH